MLLVLLGVRHQRNRECCCVSDSEGVLSVSDSEGVLLCIGQRGSTECIGQRVSVASAAGCEKSEE